MIGLRVQKLLLDFNRNIEEKVVKLGTVQGENVKESIVSELKKVYKKSI